MFQCLCVLKSSEETIARGLSLVAKKKEKFPHSPLLIRPAAQSAGPILSSIKIDDCYIKELCGDKCDTGTLGRSVG